jgi:Arc/MetJ-type ribon-helix-helix transcriptional regulator
MKRNDKRTALRLPLKTWQKMEQLIAEGKYKNLSQVVRAALRDF